MKLVYPAFIKQDGNQYLAYIPDFDGMTEGNSFVNAIEMARDYIGLMCLDYEDANRNLPPVSTEDQARSIARSKADEEDFKYSTGTLTYIDLDYARYKAKVRNQSVKKNCTLPQWLCEEAEDKGINFSRVLQEALEEKLAIR